MSEGLCDEGHPGRARAETGTSLHSPCVPNPSDTQAVPGVCAYVYENTCICCVCMPVPMCMCVCAHAHTWVTCVHTHVNMSMYLVQVCVGTVYMHIYVHILWACACVHMWFVWVSEHVDMHACICAHVHVHTLCACWVVRSCPCSVAHSLARGEGSPVHAIHQAVGGLIPWHLCLPRGAPLMSASVKLCLQSLMLRPGAP